MYLGNLVFAVAGPKLARTYLERVDLGNSFLAAVFLVVVRKENDVLAHSLDVRVVLHKFIVLQFWVQDRSAGEYR